MIEKWIILLFIQNRKYLVMYLETLEYEPTA